MAELSLVAARRGRAWSQGLHGRRRPRAPVDTVRAVVGVQAQDYVAAALSIRARAAATTRDAVVAAVRTGDCVVTWTLRGTRHLHAADDVRWLLGLLGPVFSASRRRDAQLGIGGAVGDRAARALRRALASDGPLTRAEVKERLARVGVDPSGQAAIHVIRRAALAGELCVLPGADERYALLGDVVPRPSASMATSATVVDRERAAVELARRHLAAFGPATVDDLVAWSGLPARVACDAWRPLAPELAEVAEPGRTAWVLQAARRRLVDAGRRPAGVRLLAPFDTFLLGYADRTLLVSPDHVRRVNAGGGLVKATILDDGWVVGTWRHRRRRGEGGAARVELSPFGGNPADEASRNPMAAEVADVERFLAEPEAG